jgi:hypothetical protein
VSGLGIPAGRFAVLALSGALAGSLAACRAKTSSQEPVMVTLPNADAQGGPSTDAALEAGLGEGQKDRAGHPLVTILLVPGALQDEYNKQPSFDANVPRTLEDALESRLAALDTLVLGDAGPDPVDWPVPDGGTHPLLPLFVSDVLLVDTSLRCDGDGGFLPSYLDIDREVYLNGLPHTTCGGRTPVENVVDETLTLIATGDRAPVTQGALAPTRAATPTFPYLADPN